MKVLTRLTHPLIFRAAVAIDALPISLAERAGDTVGGYWVQPRPASYDIHDSRVLTTSAFPEKAVEEDLEPRMNPLFEVVEKAMQLGKTPRAGVASEASQASYTTYLNLQQQGAELAARPENQLASASLVPPHPSTAQHASSSLAWFSHSDPATAGSQGSAASFQVASPDKHARLQGEGVTKVPETTPAGDSTQYHDSAVLDPSQALLSPTYDAMSFTALLNAQHGPEFIRAISAGPDAPPGVAVDSSHTSALPPDTGSSGATPLRERGPERPREHFLTDASELPDLPVTAESARRAFNRLRSAKERLDKKHSKDSAVILNAAKQVLDARRIMFRFPENRAARNALQRATHARKRAARDDHAQDRRQTGGDP